MPKRSLIRTFWAFWVLNGSLFIFQGPYFPFLASFTQRMSIQSACIQQWFWFKLKANFDFYLCLCLILHTSSFLVLILTAGGPYWVLISPKNGSLLGLGPYLKAWGSLLRSGCNDNSDQYTSCCRGGGGRKRRSVNLSGRGYICVAKY